MANEPLPEYLDRMIRENYVAPKMSGFIRLNSSEEEVEAYIEDDSTGRPVPIDDSADHFLLRSFDRVRRELAAIPLPKGNGICGTVWTQGEVGAGWHTNAASGEIPWRTLHRDGKDVR